MDALDCLHGRRSIRQYTEEPVSEENIRTILDAAMIAPSAGNAQPWHFLVIRDKAVMDKIPSIHPYASMASRASLGILVCGNPDEEKHKGFWVQDCAAATQNLLLACTAIGLGAVWTGVYPVEDRVLAFRELLGLPANIVPFSFLAIGHPKNDAILQSRYNEAKVHWDEW